MSIGLDSGEIKKLIESWAAKGMEKQVEAQSDQIETQNRSAAKSSANDQIEEVASEKRIRASSRESKKPAWMIDYI